MQSGYLVLREVDSHSGLVLVSTCNECPDLDSCKVNSIFWVGKFNDIDAAQMHAHGLYCRQLRDIDDRSYFISKGRAIAAIEADKLLKKTLYIEPNMNSEEQADRVKWALHYKRRKQSFNAVIFALKVLSVGYLLFILIMGF